MSNHFNENSPIRALAYAVTALKGLRNSPAFSNASQPSPDGSRYLGLGVPGYDGNSQKFKKPTSVEGDAIRVGTNQEWINASNYMFYSMLKSTLEENIQTRPKKPDGKPPEGRLQQFKSDPLICWEGLCESLKNLKDKFEENPVPFTVPWLGIPLTKGKLPKWFVDSAISQLGPNPFSVPDTEDKVLFNLVININNELAYGYTDYSERELAVDAFKNMLDLLDDFIKRFCPPKKELPDEFITYLSRFNPAVVERLLSPYWVEGKCIFRGANIGEYMIATVTGDCEKLEEIANNPVAEVGIYFTPPEGGSRTPFY